MQNIGWISHVSINPVRDIFSKTTANLGIKANDIIFPQ